MIEFVFPSEQSDCSRATAYSSTIRLGKNCRPSSQDEKLCGRQLRTMSMRLLILLGAASFCSCLTMAQPDNQLTGNSQAQNLRSDNRNWVAKPAPRPTQLEMRVPFEPTAFPSGPHFYVMYELHLTTFVTTPVSLSRIEVLDADAGAAQPMATFEAEQLETMLQPLGGKTLSDPKERVVIADGQSAIVFMSVAFDHSSHIPGRLLHPVSTLDSAAEGAVIGAHHTELHVLGPPVEGANWLAADGPSNDQDNHHRRGVVIRDGRAVDSRRYAIDWSRSETVRHFLATLGTCAPIIPMGSSAGGCRWPCCHGKRWPPR